MATRTRPWPPQSRRLGCPRSTRTRRGLPTQVPPAPHHTLDQPHWQHLADTVMRSVPQSSCVEPLEVYTCRLRRSVRCDTVTNGKEGYAPIPFRRVHRDCTPSSRKPLDRFCRHDRRAGADRPQSCPCVGGRKQRRPGCPVRSPGRVPAQRFRGGHEPDPLFDRAQPEPLECSRRCRALGRVFARGGTPD